MRKVTLSGVSETLLIPFYARAYGSLHYPKYFYDKEALEVFGKVNYNFSKFDKGKFSLWGCLGRSILLDRETNIFLKEHPRAKCISIGCGFDTRFSRVDNGETVWYGIDFPEVIELRNQIFNKKERSTWIGKNALDSDWASLIKIEEGEEVLIILEGILMYFSEEEVKTFFHILEEKFPRATILAEIMRPFVVEHQKYHDTLGKTEAVFRWGIKNSKEIEKLCSKVQYIEEWNITKEMKRFSPVCMFLLSPFFNKVNNSIVKLRIEERKS